MHAYRLRRLDEIYDMHLQAWLNHAVTATKKRGNKQEPKYKKFDDFFDYEKELRKIEGEETREITSEFKNMARIAAEVNKRQRR